MILHDIDTVAEINGNRQTLEDFIKKTSPPSTPYDDTEIRNEIAGLNTEINGDETATPPVVGLVDRVEALEQPGKTLLNSYEVDLYTYNNNEVQIPYTDDQIAHGFRLKVIGYETNTSGENDSIMFTRNFVFSLFDLQDELGVVSGGNLYFGFYPRAANGTSNAGALIIGFSTNPKKIYVAGTRQFSGYAKFKVELYH